MNKKQEQQILDYYSTADKYIRSKTHSNAHQTVFTKENDKYQWLVLEQSKAETCASLSAILPQVKDSVPQQIVNATLKKLNALSEETCAELTATTKRRKLTERDHSIKTRSAKAKEQAKQPTVAEGKQHRTHSKGKGDKAVIRKLDTLVADYPDIYKLIGQDEVSKTYSFPKSYVGYRKPRAVSTEQREWARQMMIAKHKSELKNDILSALHNADISIYEDSMQSLVYKDIQKVLEVIQKS